MSIRTKYIIFYAGFCFAALASTVWLANEPDVAITTLTCQAVLLAITVVGLFPETRASPSILSRFHLIWFVMISTAINIGCFAFIHRSIGVMGAVEPDGIVPIRDALYFSIVTFTTLGYGDIQPVPAGRLPAAFQALSGFVYLGFGIGLAVGGFRPEDSESNRQNSST